MVPAMAWHHGDWPSWKLDGWNSNRPGDHSYRWWQNVECQRVEKPSNDYWATQLWPKFSLLIQQQTLTFRMSTVGSGAFSFLRMWQCHENFRHLNCFKIRLHLEHIELLNIFTYSTPRAALTRPMFCRGSKAPELETSASAWRTHLCVANWHKVLIKDESSWKSWMPNPGEFLW